MFPPAPRDPAAGSEAGGPLCPVAGPVRLLTEPRQTPFSTLCPIGQPARSLPTDRFVAPLDAA